LGQGKSILIEFDTLKLRSIFLLSFDMVRVLVRHLVPVCLRKSVVICIALAETAC
jgi:hypothetical protein